MSYQDMEHCPVCQAPRPFWPFRVALGPDFTTPDGFRASYRSAFVTCPYCGLVFQDPMPDMMGYYASGAYRASLPQDVAELDRDEEQRADRILHLLMEKLPEHKGADFKFLDVGCSRGYLLNKMGWSDPINVFGVEPNIDYVRYRKGVVVQELEDTDRNFDLVTCIHVLEHVDAPVRFLQEIWAHTKPGGHLLVEVPSFTPGAVNPLRLAHLTAFTVQPLLMALQRAGWETSWIQQDNELRAWSSRPLENTPPSA